MFENKNHSNFEELHKNMTLYKQALTEAKPRRRQTNLLDQRLTFFSTKATICYKVILLVKKMNSSRSTSWGII